VIEKPFQKSYSAAMQTNYEVLELFPTPVFTATLPVELSNVIPWFYKQEILTQEIDAANYGERSKNSYILDEPESTKLRTYILALTKYYGSILGYDYEEYKFGQSWLSFKQPGQHHTLHSHANSLISGVFYFGEFTEKTPAIQFHKLTGGINLSVLMPKLEKNLKDKFYAQDLFSINFEPGLLVLFPSYLHHSVPVNKTDTVRCSLAFNVVPTIGFGQEGTLTEMKF
jgi:uncharacterized protein (TIGR02466 family)